MFVLGPNLWFGVHSLPTVLGHVPMYISSHSHDSQRAHVFVVLCSPSQI